MTNFLTAVLLSVVTNTSTPKIVGSHPAGQVHEYQHSVVATWELRVPLLADEHGRKSEVIVGRINNLVTNWYSLEIVPTNAPTPKLNPSVNAAKKINAVKNK